jgi:hypothetical protein
MIIRAVPEWTSRFAVLHCDACDRRDKHAATFHGNKLKHSGPNSAMIGAVNRLHTAGVECMKLVEIRRQEFICRERALLDSERKIFWLAKAEEWEQCALDEIAFRFRECNLNHADFQTATH